jgi:hypothetical protein
MSKTTSEKSKKLRIEIPSEMSGLLQKHHDTIIADESLTDVDVILFSIYLIENIYQKTGTKYKLSKELFVSFGRKEDNFRKNLYLAKKNSFIREKDRNLYFLSKGLKRIKKILGQIEKTPVYIIKSGQNFTAIRLFEEFLFDEITNNEILLCDPYVSHSTLFPFSVLKGKIKLLKILTFNIYDSSKFKDYKKKMIKELKISIEVKVNNKIHERFIISDDKCWSIGSSIKDLGNKDTTIREISEVARSMKDLFFERWNEVKSVQ